MKSSKTKYLYILITILSLWTLTIFINIATGQLTQRIKMPVTEIEVNNGYFLSVRMEVKCDWDGVVQKYKYHNFITVRKKSKSIIVVPVGLRKCELYPKIIW